MFTIQTRSYELPTTTSLAFFKDEEQFARKVRDHFLNADEPWSRLLGVHFLRQLGQKFTAGEVSVLDEAYERIVPILDAGVGSAEALPLFVRFQAESVFGDGKMKCHQGFYLLAEAGFKLVAHDGVIRTAYFLTKTPGDSYFTLFREAWRAIKARALRRQYVDHKGGRTVLHRHVEWFSLENWTCCPNPHRKPHSSTRSRKPLSPEVENWLEQVADSIAKKE